MKKYSFNQQQEWRAVLGLPADSGVTREQIHTAFEGLIQAAGKDKARSAEVSTAYARALGWFHLEDMQKARVLKSPLKRRRQRANS